MRKLPTFATPAGVRNQHLVTLKLKFEPDQQSQSVAVVTPPGKTSTGTKLCTSSANFSLRRPLPTLYEVSFQFFPCQALTSFKSKASASQVFFPLSFRTRPTCLRAPSQTKLFGSIKGQRRPGIILQDLSTVPYVARLLPRSSTFCHSPRTIVQRLHPRHLRYS